MRFIELFAGIGGFRYGLEKADDYREFLQGQESENIQKNKPNTKSRQIGFTCVYANEWNKYACQVYRKNYGGNELYEGDIREVSAESIPNHDLLTAGFPCPSFSIAGKRKGFKDPRGALFFEICRITKVKKPRLLLLENVKGLLNHEGGATFRTILYSLSKLGYDCEWEVINSAYFTVPQNRERVFIIGHLRGTGGQKVFPIGNGSREDYKMEQGKEISKTLRAGYYKQGFNSQIVLNCVGVIPESIKGKGNYLPRERIFDSEGNARAVSTIENQMPYYTDRTKIRRLTPTECERLQGFPDGWTEGISDSQRYKCLGNAVTTNVVEEIGKRIIKVQQRIF